ncbi:MAG TPA: acyl-CoA reductase, partial [Polyangiales bacterium]|nr:acyl-CoA reductase [Polyangiales bacterium]
VIAKTSAREGAFARAFHAALTQADLALATRLAIVQFPREDEAATRALCKGVDALSVYGSDETVEQLRHLSTTQQAPGPQHAKPNAPQHSAAKAAPRIIAHGHGLSAAYVAQSALQTLEQATQAAERVALDISAYDQRGCLSPHFVLVEPGAPVDPQTFAQLLAAIALPALAQLLPPGDAHLTEQAERMQWQATAAVRGELYAHAVSFEPAPLRPSPGGRLTSVYACEPEELRELLHPFAQHLKCVGIAGNKAERAAIAERLRAFSTAQVCRSGEMQTPAFDAWADGAPALEGLFTRR